MAGYTRQSIASIINGGDITAPPLNAEFNQLLAAFNASSGHLHDGTTGNAPKINLTTSVSGILPAANGGTGGANKFDATSAPTVTNDNSENYVPGSLWENVNNGRVYICVGNATGAAVWRELVTIFTNNKIEPAVHNTIDLGTPTVRFQDLYLQGGIAAAGNTALGGTLNVTGASTLAGTANITGAATMASTLGVSGNVVLSTNLNVSGTTTLSNADINSGSIDNAAIGVTTASTGAFTTITTSGQATLASADINGGSVDGAVIGAGTPAAITGTNITANTGFVGDLTGNVAGNLTGNSAGTHTGAVVGDVTGNVTASSGLSTFNNVTVNGTLDVTGTTIANVTDPSNAQDAATKNYVDTADATKLPLAGGTMSGDVTMGGNTVTGLAAPSASSDATTKTYVDTADALKLNLAGGTMSGDLAMGSNKVTGVGTPTAATDAANKAYVDAEVSAVIDAAPGALDTLNELAAAINDDANFSTTITNSISTKLPLAGGTMSGDISLGANKATSTATPATDDTLTRKGYVDTQDALKVAKAGDTMTGDLSLGSNKVTSTATPATDDTLTRKGYVDTQDALKLNLAGGTMSGDIALGSNKATSSVDPATADTLARKAYIDNADALKLNLSGGTMSGQIAMGTSKITGVGDPTSNQDVATKVYTDTQRDTRVAKSGDTMSGNLAMGSNKVTGLAAPTDTGDATNKSYVDGILGSATSAASSASAASTSATNAASSATNAASSAASAAASYDDFDDRYLGAKSSAPSTDNDGNSLLTGALYWNTSSNGLFVWTGSAWNAGAFDTSNALVATNNLSDLDNAATARTNLGFNAGVDAHLNTSTASNGEYLSWNGSDYDWASVPAGYANSDVDTHLNTGSASSGQYLGWNGSDYAWATVDTSTLMPKSGGTFTGDVAFDGGVNLEFADNAEAKFGNNGDLEIRHTGAESVIYNYNGNLTIKQLKNDADVAILTDNGSGGTAYYFLADGSTGETRLYHYGSEKLATKSSGINVTGNITVSGTVDGRDVATDGTKLDGIETNATADQTKADIDALNINADLLDGQHGSYYTGYVDTAISNLVDSSPSTLNTLNELAAALGDDANFSTTVTNSIATKMPKTGGTFTGDVTFDGAIAGRDIVFDRATNSLDFKDNARLSIGTDGDFELYHNGSNLHLFNITGNNYFRSNRFAFSNTSGLLMADMYSYGKVGLHFSGAEKLSTTSSGVTVTGTLAATAITGDGSGLTNLPASSSDLVDDTSPQLGGALQLNGNNIQADDSTGVTQNRIELGTSQDLKLYHDGNHSRIEKSGDGKLIVSSGANNNIDINAGTGGNTIEMLAATGQVRLYYGGAKKFETTSSGIDITGNAITFDGSSDQKVGMVSSRTFLNGALGSQLRSGNNTKVAATTTGVELNGLINANGDFTFKGTSYDVLWDKSQNSLEFSDNAKATFGASRDLQIHHNGASSIENYSGNLAIINHADDADVRIQTDNGQGNVVTYLQADGSTGQVQLTHYGNTKFSTETSGVSVTGDIAVTGNVDGRDVAADGTKLDGIAAGANVGIAATGGTFTGDVTFQGDNYNIVWDKSTDDLVFDQEARLDFGGGASIRRRSSGIFNITGSTSSDTYFNYSNSLLFYRSGSLTLSLGSNGINVIGNVSVSGTVDGRDVATDGTKLDGIAAGANVGIPTTGGTFTGNIDMGSNHIITEDIYLKDKLFHYADTDTYLGFSPNTVRIYAGGTNRLQADSNGVTVTGTLAATDVTGDGSGLTGLAAGFVTSDNLVGGTNAGSSLNSLGRENVFFGYNAGQDVTSGDYNSLIGRGSGATITTGGHNIAIGGYGAMGIGVVTGEYNIAIGTR